MLKINFKELQNKLDGILSKENILLDLDNLFYLVVAFFTLYTRNDYLNSILTNQILISALYFRKKKYNIQRNYPLTILLTLANLSVMLANKTRFRSLLPYFLVGFILPFLFLKPIKFDKKKLDKNMKDRFISYSLKIALLLVLNYVAKKVIKKNPIVIDKILGLDKDVPEKEKRYARIFFSLVLGAALGSLFLIILNKKGYVKLKGYETRLRMTLKSLLVVLAAIGVYTGYTIQFKRKFNLKEKYKIIFNENLVIDPLKRDKIVDAIKIAVKDEPDTLKVLFEIGQSKSYLQLYSHLNVIKILLDNPKSKIQLVNALTREELASLIYHELVHVERNHSRNTFIFMLTQFFIIFTSLHMHNISETELRLFVLLLDNLGFRERRLNEYEADEVTYYKFGETYLSALRKLAFLFKKSGAESLHNTFEERIRRLTGGNK